MISHMKDLKHTFLICNVGSVTPYPQQKIFSPFLSPYLFHLQTISFFVELQSCLMCKLYFGFLGQQLEVFSVKA